MSKGAEFTLFEFTYSEPPTGYVFTYEYATTTSPFTVEAYINGSNVGSLANTASGSITVLKSSYPQYFYQGIRIRAYLTCPEDSVSTKDAFGVFQLANDSNNIYLGSNTKFINVITQSVNIKSIILPPVTQNPYSQFWFKYMNDQANFILCPYMSNVTYPISPSRFTTTDNTYADVFDSRLSGQYSNSVVDTSFYKAAFSIFSDSSNWYYTSVYQTGLTASNIVLDSGAKYDSNSQVLYFNYTGSLTAYQVILTSNSSRYLKFVFLRNNSANGATLDIVGPPGSKMETYQGGENDYPGIRLGLSAYATRVIGFTYNPTFNTYYIMSDFDGTGLTVDSNYPASPVTLSNELGYVNDTNKDIRLAEPIQQAGYCRFNTIFTTATTTRKVVVATPADNSSNAIILPTSPARQISLSNTGGSFSYSFATLYLDSANTSVTLPLYKYQIS
jgi:hypothetical protein